MTAISEYAEEIFGMWCRGDRVSAVHELHEFDKPMALAIMAQLMLLLIDRDTQTECCELPEFVEMVEDVAFDNRILRVAQVMKE